MAIRRCDLPIVDAYGIRSDDMTPIRVVVVIAAIFLVVAITLGALLPGSESLGQLIASLNAAWLPYVQSFEAEHLGGWVWRDLTAPLLVRPVWLLPLAAGIICLGAIASINWAAETSSGRRRRS